MSFLGIVGCRHAARASASFSREPSFSLFVTIGLSNFCGVPNPRWRGNDNARIILLNMGPALD